MTVSDHGKGIPEATLQNFRSSKSPSGVGLAGMRGRVADVDGKLELECLGEGTVVRAIIPLARVSQAAQISPTPPTADALHIPSKPEKDSRGPFPLTSAP
jgi:signal transduction histidine kinase